MQILQKISRFICFRMPQTAGVECAMTASLAGQRYVFSVSLPGYLWPGIWVCFSVGCHANLMDFDMPLARDDNSGVHRDRIRRPIGILRPQAPAALPDDTREWMG